MYNEGLSYAKHNRFTEAISLLTEVVEIAPNYVNAHNLLGKIYMQLGQTDKARESWFKTLKLDPLNLVAMDCLEASSPKPFLGGFRNLVFLFCSLLVLVGGSVIYWKFGQLESKLDKIIVPVPIVKKVSSDGNGRENAPYLNQETDLLSDTNDSKASESTDMNLPINSQITKLSVQSPPQLTFPSKSVSRSELERVYDQTVKDLVLTGKYQEAVPNLIKLANSKIEHRYLIGNSYFWLGVCYRKIDQPVEALRAFQYVSQANSFKYDEAQVQMRIIQQAQRSGFH